MSVTTYTRNLRLRISSAMTADAKTNLDIIDTALSYFTRTSAGVQTFTADNGMVFRPYGDVAGGTISFGSQDVPIAGFVVYGPATATSLTLQPAGSSNTFTLLPGAMSASVSLRTPTAAGVGGQFLALSPTDATQLVFIDNVAILPALAEGSIWIGNDSNQAQETDTTAIGDISFSTSTGAVIKPGKVMATLCTGYVPTVGTVEASDTLVLALGKLQNQLNGITPLVPMNPNVLVWTDGDGLIVEYTNVTPQELAMLAGIGTNTVASQLAQAGGSKAVTFAVSNWTGPASNAYSLSVASSNHGMGTNISVAGIAEGTTNFTEVMVDSVIQTTNGDVTLTVPSSPDCRFAGRVIISRLT